jgi:hypothetical protein
VRPTAPGPGRLHRGEYGVLVAQEYAQCQGMGQGSDDGQTSDGHAGHGLHLVEQLTPILVGGPIGGYRSLDQMSRALKGQTRREAAVGSCGRPHDRRFSGRQLAGAQQTRRDD